jgi:hypothetical protein
MRILIRDFFLTFRIGNTGHVTLCFTCYCTERLERGTEGASTVWGVRRVGGVEPINKIPKNRRVKLYCLLQ